MIPAAAGDGSMVRRVLRDGRLRRRRIARGAGGRAPARPGAAGARQPAGRQRRGGPGLRPGGGVRRPLHPPDAPPTSTLLAGSGHGSHPAARSATSAPGSRIPTAGPCSTRASPWRLASNCNPGSSYSTSIPLALALAVRECGLTIDEALLAATRGGGVACAGPTSAGSSPEARADAIVIDAPHPRHLVYRLGRRSSGRFSSHGEPGAVRRPLD